MDTWVDFSISDTVSLSKAKQLMIPAGRIVEDASSNPAKDEQISEGIKKLIPQHFFVFGRGLELLAAWHG